jgi:hypothetical protein
MIPNQRKWVASKDTQQEEQKAAQMVARLQGEKLDIISSYGHQLEAFHYAGINPHTGNKVDRSAPTIIILPGMGAYHHWFDVHVEKYRKRGINVVTFNYPGVGKSGGEANREAAIQSGEAIVDYLERHFHVPREAIGAHGHSLGGGFAAQVALRRPGIHIISDRSYSKLSVASQAIIKSFLAAHPFALSILNSLRVVENGSALAFRAAQWELDSEGAWAKITGKKCVICHLKDPVITLVASLFKAIHGKDAQTTFIVMDDDCEDPHSRPLSDEETDRVIQAIGFRNLLQEPSPNLSPKQHHIFTVIENTRGGLLDLFKQKMSALWTTLGSFFRFIFRRS